MDYKAKIEKLKFENAQAWKVVGHLHAIQDMQRELIRDLKETSETLHKEIRIRDKAVRYLAERIDTHTCAVDIHGYLSCGECHACDSSCIKETIKAAMDKSDE